MNGIISALFATALLGGCGGKTKLPEEATEKEMVEYVDTIIPSNATATPELGSGQVDENNMAPSKKDRAVAVATDETDTHAGNLQPIEELVFEEDANETLRLNKGLFTKGGTGVIPDPKVFVSAVSPKPNGSKGVDHFLKRKTSGGSPHRAALAFKEPKRISLNPLSPIIAEGKEGTRLSIPPNAFEFENGEICRTPVKLSIWEFYELDDILLAGLTTESDEGLLQTAGMVYTEAESEGKPVRLRKGMPAEISFSPSFQTHGDYGLYDGKVVDNRILWSKAPEIIKGSKSPTIIRALMKKVPPEDIINRGESFAMTNGWFRNNTLQMASLGRNPRMAIPNWRRPRNIATINRDQSYEIPIGFLEFLERKNSMEDFETYDVRHRPITVKGLGEVAFPNGVRLFFNGELEILKYHGTMTADYHRYVNGKNETNPSSLDIFFTGAFICGKLPKSHLNSSLRIFLRGDARTENDFPKFVTYSPRRESGSFIINPQCLNSGYPSTSHEWTHIAGGRKMAKFAGMEGNNVRLSGYSAVPLAKLTATSRYMAKILHNYGEFGVRDINCHEGAIAFDPEFNFRLENKDTRKSLVSTSTEPLDAVFWNQFLSLWGGDTVAREKEIKLRLQKFVSNQDNPRIRAFNRNRVGAISLASQISMFAHSTPEQSRFNDIVVDRIIPRLRATFDTDEEKGIREILSAYEFIVSVERGNSEFIPDEIKIAFDKAIETMRKLKRKTEFRSQFLTPTLGWHNLDRLRHQGRRPASLTLSCDFTLPEPSSEDPDALTIDPSYYAVWPKEGVSTRAKLGENSIPSGRFVAFGFAVDEKRQIFADIKPALTGQLVRLDLKKMNRKTFRKRVAHFR